MVLFSSACAAGVMNIHAGILPLATGTLILTISLPCNDFKDDFVVVQVDIVVILLVSEWIYIADMAIIATATSIVSDLYFFMGKIMRYYIGNSQ